MLGVEQYEKNNGKIEPILVKKYRKYLDWILLVEQYEKENVKNINLNILKKRDVIKSFAKVNKEEIDVIKLLEEKETNKIQKNYIKDILNYTYPYKTATTLPTKTSVTKIKQKELEAEFKEKKLKDYKETELKIEKQILTEFPKPQFLRNDEEQKLTGAQKGTLVHMCMQRLNPKINYDLNKVKQLINELYEKQIITKKEQDAINPYKILEFTKSQIWQELQDATEVYQERPFYINIPAKEIYQEEIEEDILVQGIIDLYYIDKNNNLILVDYKTDYVEQGKENELIVKYKKQLELYQKALEKALQKKVHKKIIYSVNIGKCLEVM